MTRSTNNITTEGDAIKFLQAFEEENDLLRYQIDGWSLWPLLRFDVAMALVKLPLSKKERFSRLEQLIIAMQDIPALFRLSEKRIVVKTYSSARSTNENGIVEDLFFDDLLKERNDVFRIEGVNHKGMFKNRKSAKTLTDITALSIEISAGFISMLPFLSPDFSNTLNKLFVSISETFQLEEFPYKRILRKARFFYWGKKLYRLLLKRLKPRIVLTADPGEYLITAAAKELGIPVVEFEHGLISREHNSFYSWTKYAKPYKDSMPITDRLCLFGDFWKEDLLATGFWVDELCVTGRISLDALRKTNKTKTNEICKIALTTQGLDHEGVLKFILEFMESAKANNDFQYNLFIKMHPVYDSDRIFFQEHLAKYENVKIIGAEEKPSTNSLIASADFHWSISSTCHYDAIGLGVPTVILKLDTFKTVVSLYEKGYAFLAANGKELFEITRNWKKASVPDEVREYFYRSNALENARKEIGLS